MAFRKLCCALSLCAVVSATGAAQGVVLTAAQKAKQDSILAANGKSASSEQIADLLKKSGMTDQQLRDKLRLAGYDPSLADPYLASSKVGLAPASTEQQAEFQRMLETIGVMESTPPIDSLEGADPMKRAFATPRRKSNLFGKEIFSGAATLFDPILSGPVDPSYRLGVGDQLQLIVTGQVELAYSLEVRRDGSVIIPSVGQLALQGLTIESARALLRSRMEKSYSGLATGDARLDLTVARFRTIAVFVIGEVERPGPMQVNALSTVFTAIARAGGPTEHGSFRNIEVRRGGKVVHKLDVYDYLLSGDASDDVRLEQGDQIFVPLNSRLITAVGEVRRPKKFELRDTEGFSDLLRFAGGGLPTASTSQVQIDRILPPEFRRPGVERVKIDVNLQSRPDSIARVKLFDGDSVTFFTVDYLRRNVVTIMGEVYKPGDYELVPQMTVGDLLNRSQGLMPWALGNLLKVVRRIPRSGKAEIIGIDATTAAGLAQKLSEFDSVEVLDRRLLNPGGRIEVGGSVNKSGPRPFLENETVRDAIERAGGFRDDADLVELFRRREGHQYSDTTTLRFAFSAAETGPDSPISKFVLERDDRISVRSGPGRREQTFVLMKGLWARPGLYPVNEGVDRLHDLVRQAGGGLANSYPGGFRLTRLGRPFAVDFGRAMKLDPSHDISLLNGDTLEIWRDPATVLVTGAVSHTVLVHFETGLSIGDYIERAGGPTEKGDDKKAVIDYPSGGSKRVRKIALFFHTSPPVISGSTIIVPEKPAAATNSGEVLARVLAATSALASILVAYAALRK